LIRGWIFRQFAAAARPDLEVQPELTGTPLAGRRGERERGAATVSAHAGLSAFANLDACRRQLDQSLEHFGRRTSTSLDVPELFPDFVCFPIISSVEKLDSAQEPK
jgi:hypothetical protein